jgi:hypothetical protein
MSRDKRLTGDAGAFLVAAELALQGWPAALTAAGTTRTDVLAQVGQQRLPAAIQVKTKSAGAKDFQPSGVNSPAAAGANEWVVLVALADDRQHRFYVVPRDVVYATVQASHLSFGSRVFLGEQEYAGYWNQWPLLERPSSAAPWRMKQWVFGWRDRMDWPDGHPGIPDDTEIIEAPESRRR